MFRCIDMFLVGVVVGVLIIILASIYFRWFYISHREWLQKIEDKMNRLERLIKGDEDG